MLASKKHHLHSGANRPDVEVSEDALQEVPLQARDVYGIVRNLLKSGHVCGSNKRRPKVRQQRCVRSARATVPATSPETNLKLTLASIDACATPTALSNLEQASSSCRSEIFFGVVALALADTQSQQLPAAVCHCMPDCSSVQVMWPGKASACAKVN